MEYRGAHAVANRLNDVFSVKRNRAGEHVDGEVIKGLCNHGRAGTQHYRLYLSMNVCEDFLSAVIQN